MRIFISLRKPDLTKAGQKMSSSEVSINDVRGSDARSLMDKATTVIYIDDSGKVFTLKDRGC